MLLFISDGLIGTLRMSMCFFVCVCISSNLDIGCVEVSEGG